MEMLQHDDTIVAQRGEKWMVPKCDEQDEDKGKESPTSYKVKPKGSEILENTTGK